MDPVLKLENVSKVYQGDGRSVEVLDAVNLVLEAGQTRAVVGPSGSGKTTLLSLCAGLDSPSSGEIHLLGKSLGPMSEEDRARVRNRFIGFIFQSFHLMPSLTALENVMLPLELLGGRQSRERGTELLEKVGLQQRLDHYPSQLSGGEQQRVAIARAFINRPRILFADEPTGNLDRETAERITALLFELNQDEGTTLLLITHDSQLAARTGGVLYLRQGKLHAEV